MPIPFSNTPYDSRLFFIFRLAQNYHSYQEAMAFYFVQTSRRNRQHNVRKIKIILLSGPFGLLRDCRRYCKEGLKYLS